MHAADDDPLWRPRPSPGPEPAIDPDPALAVTLATLEGSLRDVADQVARARAELYGEAPPGSGAAREQLDGRAPPRPTPARDGLDDAAPPRPEPEDQAPPGGRARLREGPLGHLFRSTLDGTARPSIAYEPLDAPLPDAPQPLPDAPPPLNGHAPADPADTPDEATWLEPRVTEVEPRRARIVANCERELGAEHPDTLWAVHDLGAALAKAGETAPARRLAARLVAVRNRTLGPEHPHTIRAYQLRGLL